MWDETILFRHRGNQYRAEAGYVSCYELVGLQCMNVGL